MRLDHGTFRFLSWTRRLHKKLGFKTVQRSVAADTKPAAEDAIETADSTMLRLAFPADVASAAVSAAGNGGQRWAHERYCRL
jgi:hypothetical protein